MRTAERDEDDDEEGADLRGGRHARLHHTGACGRGRPRAAAPARPPAAQLAVARHERRDARVVRRLELLRRQVDVDLARRRGAPTRSAIANATFRSCVIVIAVGFEPLPQLLDDPHEDVRRDRVEAGRRLVEEEDLGLRARSRARSRRGAACRPTAPTGASPRCPGSRTSSRHSATRSRDLLLRLLRVPHERKRDVLAHAHRVEERALLERHPELPPQDVALAGRRPPRGPRPSISTVPASGFRRPMTCFRRTLFPIPDLPRRTSDSPFATVEVEAGRGRPSRRSLRDARAGGSRRAAAAPHQKSTFVRKKSAMRIASEPMTTAAVVDAAHALRAALRVEAALAADQRQEEAEDRRLDEARRQVVHVEELERVVRRRRRGSRRGTSTATRYPPEDADRVREDDEHRERR